MLKEYPATCTVPRLQKSHGRTTLEQEIGVIAPLRKLLDQHRARCGNPETSIMSQARTGAPLSMNNLLSHQILPARKKCSECRGAKRLHAKPTHYEFIYQRFHHFGP